MTAVLTSTAKRSGRRRMRWQIAPFSALICALSTLKPVDALASHSAAPSQAQAQAQAQQNHQQTAHLPAIPLAKELYSVAPMMGHSNRHYRHFIRLMGLHRAHLYTEMIPASQIVRAYNRARGIYFGDNRSGNNNEGINADEILELVQRTKEDPSKEYQRLPGDMDDNLTLHQLVATSHSSGLAEHPVVLQLGGNDIANLGMAAAIGAAYGEGEYSEINLNCGCPSNAVGGRAGGCALMKEPELVARCVESMNGGAQSVSSTRDGVSAPGITVKHRLGVRDAMTYDATTDRAKDDEEAFGEVSDFIKTVAQAGVKKFHVHARLGLLGEFPEYDDDDDDGNIDRGARSKNKRPKQSLWVPGANDNALPKAQSIGKIDHKREQERARRRARKATIKNREVPPLRNKVVNRLADEFQQYEFVSNGQIGSFDEVKAIVEEGNRVIGAMVGRAAINHPCSFSAADTLWDGKYSSSIISRALPTRGQVLDEYIRYCDEEENRLASYGASPQVMEKLRRRLVACPFHLFTGEDGSDKFQRHLKKLREKSRTVRASSILAGAASFVPAQSLAKHVDDFVPWEDIGQYHGGLKRGSACQRIVY